MTNEAIIWIIILSTKTNTNDQPQLRSVGWFLLLRIEKFVLWLKKSGPLKLPNFYGPRQILFNGKSDKSNIFIICLSFMYSG